MTISITYKEIFVNNLEDKLGINPYYLAEGGDPDCTRIISFEDAVKYGLITVEKVEKILKKR